MIVGARHLYDEIVIVPVNLVLNEGRTSESVQAVSELSMLPGQSLAEATMLMRAEYASKGVGKESRETNAPTQHGPLECTGELAYTSLYFGE